MRFILLIPLFLIIYHSDGQTTPKKGLFASSLATLSQLGSKIKPSWGRNSQGSSPTRFGWVRQPSGQVKLTPIEAVKTKKAPPKRGKRSPLPAKTPTRPTPTPSRKRKINVVVVEEYDVSSSDSEIEYDDNKALQYFEWPVCRNDPIRDRRAPPESHLTVTPTGWSNQRGLKWASGPSVANTCNIDSFLSNFLFRIFKRKDFVKMHLGLPDYDRGESALREIERLSLGRDITGLNFTADTLIKEAWIRTGMNRRIIPRGPAFDCLGLEIDHIFGNLKDSSKMALVHTCGCDDKIDSSFQADNIEDMPMTPEKLGKLMTSPYVPTDPKITRRGKKKCSLCKEDFRFVQAVVGNCTWFLRFTPAPEASDPTRWPDVITFTNIESPRGLPVSFQKEYASFGGPSELSRNPVDETGPVPEDVNRLPLRQRPQAPTMAPRNPSSPTRFDLSGNTHQVSFHFFDDKIFYYDGIVNDGKMRSVRSPLHYIRTRRLEPDSIVYVRTDGNHRPTNQDFEFGLSDDSDY